MNLKEVIEWIKKFGTQADKERFRIVFRELEKLKIENAKLKKTIAEMSQNSLLPDKEKEQRVRAMQQKIVNEVTRPDWVGETRDERLYSFKKNNSIGSKEWELALRYGRLTFEEAMQRINDFEKTLKKTGD